MNPTTTTPETIACTVCGKRGFHTAMNCFEVNSYSYVACTSHLIPALAVIKRWIAAECHGGTVRHPNGRVRRWWVNAAGEIIC